MPFQFFMIFLVSDSHYFFFFCQNNLIHLIDMIIGNFLSFFFRPDAYRLR